MESKLTKEEILDKIQAKLEKKIEDSLVSEKKSIIHPSHHGGGMGRPKGAKNTYKARWNPRKWKVEHEVIVLMHVNGKSNKEIAEIHGRSITYVSLLINCDKAKEMIERIRLNLPMKSLEDRYSKIVDKATDRVVEYLENDTIAQSTPGAMADRAMRAMEMIDTRLKAHKDTNNITNNTLVLATQENVERLTKALARSDEVTANFRMKDD